MSEIWKDQDGNEYEKSEVDGEIILTDKDGNTEVILVDENGNYYIEEYIEEDVWIGGSREWDNDGYLGDHD